MLYVRTFIFLCSYWITSKGDSLSFLYGSSHTKLGQWLILRVVVFEHILSIFIFILSLFTAYLAVFHQIMCNNDQSWI